MLLQALEEPLDVGIAPEEELGVLLFEGLEAAVGAHLRASSRCFLRADRDPHDGVDEPLEQAAVVDPAAEVHPRARRDERGEVRGIERLRDPRQQHGTRK